MPVSLWVQSEVCSWFKSVATNDDVQNDLQRQASLEEVGRLQLEWQNILNSLVRGCCVAKFTIGNLGEIPNFLEQFCNFPGKKMSLCMLNLFKFVWTHDQLLDSPDLYAQKPHCI